MLSLAPHICTCKAVHELMDCWCKTNNQEKTKDQNYLRCGECSDSQGVDVYKPTSDFRCLGGQRSGSTLTPKDMRQLIQQGAGLQCLRCEGFEKCKGKCKRWSFQVELSDEKLCESCANEARAKKAQYSPCLSKSGKKKKINNAG